MPTGRHAYPLAWPRGQARTPAARRRPARFRTTPGDARIEMLLEFERLGAMSELTDAFNEAERVLA